MSAHPQHIYCAPEMLPENFTQIASQGAVMGVDWEQRPAEELLIAATQYWNGTTFANGTNEIRFPKRKRL